MLDSLLRADYMGFVVNKLATEEVYIRVLGFSPLSIILPRLHIHALHQPADGQWAQQRLHVHTDFVSPHHTSITKKCYVIQRYVIYTAHGLGAGLLARSQYPEGPATDHHGTGFSWFPCVYKRMLRWFPRLPSCYCMLLT